MFRRKSANQTKNLLEYLAGAQQEQQLKSKRVIAQTAVADEKNADLATKRQKLENLLSDALARDSFIDVDSLKETPRISAFNRTRPELRSYLPKPPSSFALLFPWKKSAYDREYESAESRFKNDRQDYDTSLNEHQRQVDRIRAEAEIHNEEIRRHKQDFAAGEPAAIAEYFGLVLEYSTYPAGFPKQTKISYAAESKKLRIEFALPATDVMPATKRYEYDKIRDEITQTVTPWKQCRLLYSSTLAQISLRTIYEVFTADRANRIDNIVFDGYVDGVNPSTGQRGRFFLVDINITRQQFDSLDLRQVEPRACLKGLNARLSKKPDQLLAMPTATQVDNQDTTVTDENDIHDFKRQISELKGTIQTQSAQISELESKLVKRRDKNGELASSLRQKDTVITELERRLESQRDRFAELVPDLRDERERNDELNAEIQKRNDHIAELESRLEARMNSSAKLLDLPTEAPEDTQPIETIVETTSDSDLDSAGIFAPIASETPDDGGRGALIPPREPVPQNSNELAQKLKLLEIMSVFAEAQGSYVDYIGQGLPKEQINRLVREGRLERHKFHTYKLRATLAGNKWYRERLSLQDPPEPEPASPSPKVKHEAEKTIRLGELLSGEAASSVAADIKRNAPAHRDNNAAELLQRPPGTPDDLLTDLEELVTIMGDYGSETSRLIVIMAENNWACNHDALEAIFRQDENVTFANNIIDIINDRANEKVEHPLIIEENDQWIIDEEFRDEIEHILKHPEYLSNS